MESSHLSMKGSKRRPGQPIQIKHKNSCDSLKMEDVCKMLLPQERNGKYLAQDSLTQWFLSNDKLKYPCCGDSIKRKAFEELLKEICLKCGYKKDLSSFSEITTKSPAYHICGQCFDSITDSQTSSSLERQLVKILWRCQNCEKPIGRNSDLNLIKAPQSQKGLNYVCGLCQEACSEARNSELGEDFEQLCQSMTRLRVNLPLPSQHNKDQFLEYKSKSQDELIQVILQLKQEKKNLSKQCQWYEQEMKRIKEQRKIPYSQVSYTAPIFKREAHKCQPSSHQQAKEKDLTQKSSDILGIINQMHNFEERSQQSESKKKQWHYNQEYYSQRDETLIDSLTKKHSSKMTSSAKEPANQNFHQQHESNSNQKNQFSLPVQPLSNQDFEKFCPLLGKVKSNNNSNQRFNKVRS